MNEVREAIYERLAADATLTGLLSAPTAIYHQVAPQSAAAPLVVFNKAAGTPNWQFGGAHVQGDVWLVKAIDRGTSASRAEDIAARIDAVLTDAPLAIDGGVLLGVWRESDVDYLEIDGGDQWHHVGSQYRLLSQPS